MERLTTDKPVREMNNTELAHNACYGVDGLARYRDFDMDVDARDLCTRLVDEYCGLEGEFHGDLDFDEFMADALQYGPEEPLGLIALFYRSIWAQAELRARLKRYEDLEEAGRLVTLPCNPKDTVFLIESVYAGRKKIGETVAKAEIDRFIIADGKGPVADVCTDGGGWYEAMEPKDFFRTREEAVAAMLLEEQADHG